RRFWRFASAEPRCSPNGAAALSFGEVALVAASQAYREVHMTSSRFTVAVLLVALVGSPSVADVVSDWNTAVIPPPPELKEVTIDPSTTALLFLDIMKGGCTARPRCVAAVPN